MALELSDLSLPLTRSQADAALSKDYGFRVLEDLTVRRSWKLRNRTVSVDFSPKEGDKALLIFIDYGRPVTKDEAEQDAEQMMRSDIGKWSPLKPQRAAKLGMEAAEGVKQEGGRYCFRELDEDGRVVRLAYYSSVPGEARWDLADDARESGKTAMGTRSRGGSSEFLWKDEERRLGVSASSSPESLDSAAAAAVAGAPAGPAVGKPAPPAPVARPDEPVDIAETFRLWLAKLTPTHYAIGGALVALWLLWRMIAHAREAKRRAMVTNYIMNRGRIRTEDEDE